MFPFGETIHVSGAHVSPGDALAVDVREFLRARGFADADAASIDPTVEDVFIELTGSKLRE